jgi:mRNA interferase RelE/StbE
MAWKIEFDRHAKRELDRLDPQQARRILKFLHTRLAPAKDPRGLGEALVGPELGKYWKYRVGDYRLIVRIQDALITVLVLRIANRKAVYR